jgi:hypothetical protein
MIDHAAFPFELAAANVAKFKIFGSRCARWRNNHLARAEILQTTHCCHSFGGASHRCLQASPNQGLFLTRTSSMLTRRTPASAAVHRLRDRPGLGLPQSPKASGQSAGKKRMDP